MAALDVKQLQDASKQIAKAAETNEPPSVLLALLAPLENVKATEDLLRQSKIGVAVTKLRQIKDPKVSEAAARLVNRWKAEVKSSKDKRPNGSPVPSSHKNLGGSLNGRSETSSPAPPPAAAKTESKKYIGDVDKRNTNTDAVNHKLTGNDVRDACLKLMYDGTAYMSEEPAGTILDVARRIEVAAFEHFKHDTGAAYKAKIRSLFQNLKVKSNSALRKNVVSGKIAPQRFVTMTSDELKSAERQAQDDAIEKENMNRAMTAQEVKAISTTMTCGKCKQSKVSYSQAQTRSADEPLTTFCECINCGHRWKFS